MHCFTAFQFPVPKEILIQKHDLLILNHFGLQPFNSRNRPALLITVQIAMTGIFYQYFAGAGGTSA